MSGGVSSIFSSAEITSIVGQLKSRIDAPIQVEQAQIKTDNVQISALGAVQGALSSLNGALSGISDPASINAMKASTSSSGIASATASASAASGSYALTNVTLAKTQEIYSSTFASANAAIGAGSGTIAFKFGNGSSATINIPSSADTVSGVENAINAANKGVTASIVNTASGARLVLQSTEPGSSNAFTVTGTGAAASLSYGSGSGTMSLGQAARDASFTVNGVPVTETSNSSISLVNGLTVSLKSSGSTTVSVSNSPSNLSSALSTFTNKLNNAISVITKQTAYASAKSSASAAGSSPSVTAGPLLGNVQIQQLKQDLMSAVSSAAGSGFSANSLGLTISSAGTLSFSSSTFATAYKSNPTGVDNLIKTIETNVSNIVISAIGTAGSSTTAGSGSGTAASGFVGAATTDVKTSVISLNNEIAQQTLIGNEQVTNLESEFTAAINTTSGSSNTLSYLTALIGSGSSTSGG